MRLNPILAAMLVVTAVANIVTVWMLRDAQQAVNRSFEIEAQSYQQRKELFSQWAEAVDRQAKATLTCKPEPEARP